MLLLLSPSKALDFETPTPPGLKPTKPRHGEHSAALLRLMQAASRADLKRLMDISDALAELNFARYQAFAAAAEKPAALAFDGDVYTGLDAPSLSPDDLAAAQERLRILSGFYGLLRPLDAIKPYRLEMGVKLANPRGEDLYAFWGDRLARQLDADLKRHPAKVIVNLASDEYASAVDRKALKAAVVTPVFKELKDGKARALFMYLKRARGAMARWAIQNRIDAPEALKEFAADGYRFDPKLSSDEEWVFARPQPQPAKPAKKKAPASA